MTQNTDGILRFPIRFAYETLGLNPNQVSIAGFVVGMIAAILVGIGFLVPGLIALALSQVIDGIDGGVARRYNLQSSAGQLLEIVFDRLNELAIFLALAYAGYVTYFIAVLAFVAILLVTILEPISKFDPGFKRFMIYFGYLTTVVFGVQGFQIAIHVIFWANLAAFAIGTVLVDLRLQKQIDEQEILRRRTEAAMGVPPLPDDPPSFLSRLFA